MRFDKAGEVFPHGDRDLCGGRSDVSYDLTIAKDETFSAWTRFSDLADFLRVAEHVKPNGQRGFVFEPSTDRCMFIDLEVVSDEGDNIEEKGREYREINCVRLHIPYAMLGNHPDRDYFPLALAIAERLGWTAYDNQTGELISRDQIERNLTGITKP
jgi:hypothetical protein